MTPLLTNFMITLLFLSGVYIVAVLERWSLTGHLIWSGPFRSFLLLFARAMMLVGLNNFNSYLAKETKMIQPLPTFVLAKYLQFHP